MIVLVCWGLATAGATDEGPVGQYLMSYDVDAHDGRGTAAFTDDLTQALTFHTIGDAIDTWRTQSTVRPKRDDGMPNRPLTAFSMEPRAL